MTAPDVTPDLGSGLRVWPAPNVHARALGDELVVLDFAGGEYFSLDRVGAVVWRRIERGATLEEVVTALTERYDVSHSAALDDAQSLLRELFAHSLIVGVRASNV